MRFRWAGQAVRTMTTMALKEQKTALRQQVTAELKKLEAAEIERQCKQHNVSVNRHSGLTVS